MAESQSRSRTDFASTLQPWFVGYVQDLSRRGKLHETHPWLSLCYLVPEQA